MKLLHVISIRLLVITAVILALWAVLFYRGIMQEINNEADEALREYAESIIIRDARGEPLPSASSGSNNQFFIRPVTEEYAKSQPQTKYENRDVYVAETNEYEPARVYTYIYKDIDGHWQEIEVSTPHVDKDAMQNVMISWLIFLLTAIMLAIVAVNVWAVQHSMRPLHNLLQWLENFRLGKQNKPLNNPTTISEFVQLNETVMRSMQRNEQLFEQQKLFIGNASHELQTPIAVCQSRLEMMLEDETLSDDQIEEIGKTLQTMGSMSRLNRSLLLLCKIENGQFNDTKRMDLAVLLEQLINDYQEIYAHKDIKLIYQPKEHMVVKMDESLASVLLANLLKNAYVHNIQGGRITITMNRQELRFSNTGSFIELDDKKVFNRFYHESNKKTSTGLGLSIVKAICNQYGLEIRYRFGEGKHHFILTITN